MPRDLVKILAIAGSDSSAGAGIQADIKTILSLGGYACSAITCITAQNKLKINDSFNIKETLVMSQIETVCSDLKFDAIKIGVIPNLKLSYKLLDFFKSYRSPVVVDPVFISSSGYSLVDSKNYLKNQLILAKIASILTPNINEAEKLLGNKISNEKGISDSQIRKLYKKFNTPILVKGGHLIGRYKIDTFCDRKGIVRFKNRSIETEYTHGTGCSLASAISFFLGERKKLNTAVELSISYIRRVLLKSKKKRFNGYLYHQF